MGIEVHPACRTRPANVPHDANFLRTCITCGVATGHRRALHERGRGKLLQAGPRKPASRTHAEVLHQRAVSKLLQHAGQDPNPDCSVELRDANVAAILFLAVEDYIRFRQGGPVEAQVFQLWFIAVFPEKVTEDDPVAQSKLESAKLAFPGIATLASSDQVEMGQQVLEAARKDAGLAADPKTEPSL